MRKDNSQKQFETRYGIKVLVACVIAVSLCSYLLSANIIDRAFKRGDQRLMELWDSGIYLVSARTLIAINSQLKSPEIVTAEQHKKQMKGLADMLILDGPVLPALAAKAILVGTSAKVQDANAIACLMCLLQSITSALVFLCCYRATASKHISLGAGLIWAIYPPALIATQRVGTETLSAALLLAVLLCLSLTSKRKNNSFGCLIALAYGGIFFALLLLTKPVLMFSVLIPFFFVSICMQRKAALKAVLVFGAATTFTMLPYWLFTAKATGAICFVPQRIPIFNALVSNSLISDGLQCIPQTPVSEKVAKMNSVPAIEMALFLEDPVAHIDLNLRKLPRLFAEPWNDFRRSAWFAGPIVIRFVHQILGLCAFSALSIALALIGDRIKSILSKQSDRQLDPHSQTVVIFLLAALSHLIYTGFEGIPRYGYTAVPLLLILASWMFFRILAFGYAKLRLLRFLAPVLLLSLLSNIAQLPLLLTLIGSPITSSILLGVISAVLFGWLMVETLAVTKQVFNFINRQTIKLACLICFAAFFLPMILTTIHDASCADLTGSLSGPVLGTRQIDLSRSQKTNDSKKAEWAMILIDSGKEIAQSHITFNGHKIYEVPRSIFYYYQDRYNLQNFQKQLASLLNVKIDELRQWRAVPVPIAYVSLDGLNKISISPPPALPLTIYGDYNELAGDIIPTLGYVSQSRVFVSADSLDWRPRWHVLTRVPSESFIESNDPKSPSPPNPDLSAAPGGQKGRYRIMLAVGFNDKKNVREFNPTSRTIPFDSLNFSAAPAAMQKTPGALKFNATARADYELNAQPRSTHIIVEIDGTATVRKQERKQAIISVRLAGPQISMQTMEAHPGDPLYFDCLGQAKVDTLSVPNATQMLMLSEKQSVPLAIKAVYPLNAIRGRGNHLTVEIMPVPEGTPIYLEGAQLSVREVEWPDLDHGEVIVY